MLSRISIAFAGLLLALLSVSPYLLAQRNRKNTEEPKIAPLPPQLPMALAAETENLDFHISPLLPTGGLSAQIRESINTLLHDTHSETIIKLRAFVAGAGDARRVAATVAQVFTERKLPLPVVSILQVGSLGQDTAQVVMEAVVSTRRVLNPNGLAFLAGQSAPTFAQALEHLRDSAAAAQVPPDHVLSCTCFTSAIADYASVRATVQAMFPNTAISVIAPLRDPSADNTMCEAVGQLTQAPSEGSVVWLKNARATLVNSHQLVFTGLQLTFGDFLDDAHEAFARLERAASAVDAVETPVEVNAFSLDASSGSALRKTTSVPLSTFTVQTVEGLPAIDASAGIEAVLAPKVTTPVTIAR